MPLDFQWDLKPKRRARLRLGHSGNAEAAAEASVWIEGREHFLLLILPTARLNQVFRELLIAVSPCLGTLLYVDVVATVICKDLLETLLPPCSNSFPLSD